MEQKNNTRRDRKIYIEDSCVEVYREIGCADSGGEIQEPIPNSEVKPANGDGTALLSVGE